MSPGMQCYRDTYLFYRTDTVGLITSTKGLTTRGACHGDLGLYSCTQTFSLLLVLPKLFTEEVHNSPAKVASLLRSIITCRALN